MQLGIHNLEDQAQLLEHGNTYWLNVPNRNQAISIAVNSLHVNNTHKCSLILNNINALDIKNLGISPITLSDISAKVYETTYYPYFFKKLISDLERASIAKDSDIAIVVLSSELVLNTDYNELKYVLNDLNHYLIKRNLALLFISYTVENINCSARIAQLSSYLTGISSLTLQDNDSTKGHYQVSFWRTSNGTIASGDNAVCITNKGCSVISNEHVDITNANDINDFYLVGSNFNPDSRSYLNIYRYPNNIELFNAALSNCTQASCMFKINDRAEIDELGKYVYHLRKQRGNSLVILVWEQLPGIRASSERFLLTCGANFIFESTATSTYINAMLSCFKGYFFNRNTSISFDSLLTRYHEANQQKLGFLAPNDFAKNVAQQLSSIDLDIIGHGVLVVLTIKKILQTEMVTEQFIPVRIGDVCTILNHSLVVFLPSCNENELTTALKRVFSTELNKLFDNYFLFSQDHEILAEVEKLNHEEMIRPMSKSQIKMITDQQTYIQKERKGLLNSYNLGNTVSPKTSAFNLSNLKR